MPIRAQKTLQSSQRCRDGAGRPAEPPDQQDRAARPAGRAWTACGRLNYLRLPPDCAGPLLPEQGRPRSFLRRSAGSFLGLLPCPASRCDPCGRLCGGGWTHRPQGRGTPAHRTRWSGRDREAPDEHHQNQQQHSQHHRRAGQAHRTARADQRRCRRAGGHRGVAGDAGHRREVPQLQPGKSAADRAAGAPGHPGCGVPQLAEPGPAGT